jgi:hypothetical protein
MFLLRAHDQIPLGGRSLRVLEIRDDDADQPPVLVVQDASEWASSLREWSRRRVEAGRAALLAPRRSVRRPASASAY